MNATISQELIERVEQDAMQALADYLEETKAPAWVGQVIQDLRLLDQIEEQELDNFVLGDRGRNAELGAILSRLVESTWQRPGEAVTIPATS